MRSGYLSTLACIILLVPRTCLGQVEVGVEEKIRNALGVVCYDDCGLSLEARLLAVADRETIVTSLIKILDDYQSDGSRASKTLTLSAIGSLSELKDAKAVPALKRIAEQSDQDLRAVCVRIIGATDARSNRDFLLKMLHDDYYPVRHGSARGLAQLDDTDVLAELNVQASREGSYGGFLEIQKLADGLRDRIRSRRGK